MVLDDQGDDVSSHADTIRAALVAPMPGGWGANDPEVALDALLAENQRLREALERISEAELFSKTGITARDALGGDAE